MAALRVVLVHHHLRGGGVTRVIADAASALRAENVAVVVLVGEPPPRPIDGLDRIEVVDGLGYAPSANGGDSTALAARMRQAARRAFGADPDLWHVHNHALGKNPAVTAAVAELARAGCRLLLQIHDFAEDGRPADYRRLRAALGSDAAAGMGPRLYPLAPHVHYAALNERDFGFLRRAGVPAEQLHLLANAVRPPVADAAEQSDDDEGRLFLYPTRAIRRKNVGELLLWAALAREGDRFATTLAPKNPAEQPAYQHWVDLAAELDLPANLGINEGDGTPLRDLMQRAHAVVTTSVAEGFGLAFLEPWLHERALLGRDLPEVTGQFRAAGVDLGELYERVDVPVEWLGLDTLRRRITDALQAYLAAYGRRLGGRDVERAMSALVVGDRLDFGRLDAALQEQVIRRLRDDPAARQAVKPAWLDADGDERRNVVAANRRTVLREYSPTAYGARLRRIYDAVLAGEVDTSAPEAISAETLLDEFLAPERFSLLRAT